MNIYLSNIMITFVGGNLEVKLRLVRDSFYSWGVSKKNMGINMFFYSQ